MGGVYLDVIKDRQYTTQSDSLARRSVQTALYHIVQAFSRWIAPILSFTADELYEFIPQQESSKKEAIFLEDFYGGLDNLLDEDAGESSLMQVVAELKVAVNKAIEAARNDGLLKASLEAEIVVYAEASLAEQYEKLEDELRFALITSRAQVAPLDEAPAEAFATDLEGVKVLVQKSAYQKCVRCWHYREEIGVNPQHPELCGRCVDNVVGAGEVRMYA